MGDERIVIRAAGFDDSFALARIHYQALPDDFLPFLGQDFLEKVYYPSGLSSGNASTFVAEYQGDVAGFVTVAQNSDQYTRDVLCGHYMTIAHYAIRAALHSPAHLLCSAEVFYAALFTPADPVKAEIVFIAVDKNYRRQGIGKTLVAAAMAYLDESGESICRTKTLASNSGVIAMYEKLGWRIRDRFRLIGCEYVTLLRKRE